MKKNMKCHTKKEKSTRRPVLPEMRIVYKYKKYEIFN